MTRNKSIPRLIRQYISVVRMSVDFKESPSGDEAAWQGQVLNTSWTPRSWPRCMLATCGVWHFRVIEHIRCNSLTMQLIINTELSKNQWGYEQLLHCRRKLIHYSAQRECVWVIERHHWSPQHWNCVNLPAVQKMQCSICVTGCGSV